MQSFEDFNFNKQILTAIQEAGFTEPSPIQEKLIPLAMAGQDLMGIAPTGTGKTAAYVLPILMKLRYAQEDYPRALILAPTRELAMQIADVIKQLASHTGLRHAVIYGGLGPKTQIEQIKKGIDILVATPGRLLDLYLEGHLVLKKVNFLVIDEADKMMDMGFIGSLHRILEVIPRKRQNLLLSATMSDLVHKIAGDFMKFPTTVEIEQQATPAILVNQQLYFVPNRKTKINLMMTLLTDEENMNRVLIFCRTKETANQLHSFLARRLGEANVRVIHGNKGQHTRINTINKFKEGGLRILVATDVSARGIDVTNVSHVFNFDVPIIYEDYVHRIGRTGRANQTGEAITFCTESEQYHLKKIEKLIRKKIPVLSIPLGVFIEETAYDEKQDMAKEIDRQKRKEDPEFMGAFHEKAAAKQIIEREKNKARKEKAKTKKFRSRK